MTARLVRGLDVPAQRWRNGGGMTRELLAWPAGDAWQVRVSVADIQTDGPFSAYPGVDRWFTVLQGTGVELRIGDKLHRLGRGDAPLRFAGDAPADCRLLDGPTRDLNLMLRQTAGTMQIASDALDWSPRAAQCGLFSAVAGQCEAGESKFEVPAYALLWFDVAPPSLMFTAAQRPAGVIGWWLAATPLEAGA